MWTVISNEMTFPDVGCHVYPLCWMNYVPEQSSKIA